MNNTRFLSSEEIELLLNLSISAESNWEILLTTSDEILFSDIQNLFLNDEQVKIEKIKFGCDALISCAKKIPDLLIIDEELPDIPSDEVIKCIKRNDDLKNIKILCRLKESNAIDFPEWGADDYFKKYDLDKVYLSRKVKSLLYTSEIYPETVRGSFRERRWPRTKLNITAKIEMCSLNDPKQSEQGDAVIEDISRGGAYLSRIKLKKGLIPDETYQIRLKVEQPPLKDWKADSIIVRFKTTDSVGIKFANISKDDQLKVAKLFDK